MVRRQKDVKILYGLVLISTLIKSVLLENASDNYSLSNDIDFYFEKFLKVVVLKVVVPGKLNYRQNLELL